MKILIKNGRIIDPSRAMDEKGDLLVENGKIACAGGTVKTGADKTINADGMIVSPGFVDMHTHLREPGREDAETLETGLSAAIAGGFTTVSAMPNTDPACDNQAQVKFLLEKAARLGLARILPIGAITRGRIGEQLTEMGELKAAGSPAVSDDGDAVMDAEVMRRAMEYAAMTDMLTICHCEDKALAGEGVMHEGYWSTVLGMKPMPAEAESIIVDRDIRIAALTGARVHIAHVSTAQSVEMIRSARKAGVQVTAEATPHHFTLTDGDLKTYDTSLKVNPPLRSAEDVLAVKKGLADGTIEVVATDHAPHPVQEKEKEFDHAPFGMIGLETALSLAVMRLVDEGYLDWPGLISALSTAPCRILKYNRGTLTKGEPADITVIDPSAEWVYTKESIRSLSKNSPFIGWKLKAKVTHVLVDGRILLGAAD